MASARNPSKPDQGNPNQAQIKRIRHKDDLVAYDVYCEGYRFTEQNVFGNRLFYANENLDAIFKIQEEMRTKSFKTPRIEQTESSIRNHPIIPMSNLKTSAPRGGSAPGIPRYGFNIKIAFRITLNFWIFFSKIKIIILGNNSMNQVQAITICNHYNQVQGEVLLSRWKPGAPWNNMKLFGSKCPRLIETRWISLFSILHWLKTHAGKVVPLNPLPATFEAGLAAEKDGIEYTHKN